MKGSNAFISCQHNLRVDCIDPILPLWVFYLYYLLGGDNVYKVTWKTQYDGHIEVYANKSFTLWEIGKCNWKSPHKVVRSCKVFFIWKYVGLKFKWQCGPGHLAYQILLLYCEHRHGRGLNLDTFKPPVIGAMFNSCGVFSVKSLK